MCLFQEFVLITTLIIVHFSFLIVVHSFNPHPTLLDTMGCTGPRAGPALHHIPSPEFKKKLYSTLLSSSSTSILGNGFCHSLFKAIKTACEWCWGLLRHLP